MSDEEINKNDLIEEEEPAVEQDVDDLFGSDDNDDEQQNSQDDDDEEDEISSGRKSKSNKRSKSDVDDGESNTDNEDPEEEDEEEENEEDLKVIDISLPRHAIVQAPEEDIYAVKVPTFLNVDAHPFDPNEFKEQIQQNAVARKKSTMNAKQVKNDLIAEKLLNENSIRWRYSNSGNDEIIKQSNTHFVEWDDGSISLKVGNELFDFKSLPLFDNFLVKTHDQYEILQNDSVLTKSANLLPSSTFTSTHKKLTEALKNTQKKDKILNTMTDEDPELIQRLADENERKSIKLKRQIEQRRRLQEERLEKTGSPAPGLRSSSSRNSYEPAYERFERTYGNEEYDDEDDFVAGDDEELEEGDEDEDQFDDEDEEEEFDKGAERLKKLKNEGDAKYKKNATPPAREGDDEEDTKQRKKRRIIDSDDEE